MQDRIGIHGRLRLVKALLEVVKADLSPISLAEFVPQHEAASAAKAGSLAVSKAIDSGFRRGTLAEAGERVRNLKGFL